MTTITIPDMLRYCAAAGGSDIHVRELSPVKIRVHGRLHNVAVNDTILVFSEASAKRVLLDILTEEQAAYFGKHHELDFAYKCFGAPRFRVNYFYVRMSLCGVFRIIPGTSYISMERLSYYDYR